MDINIYCPNCKTNVDRKNFFQAEDPREFYCEVCSSRFNLAMIDEGEQSVDRLHNNAEFDLRIGNNENYTWRKLDDNLDPILVCPLCTGEVSGNKENPGVSKKCRKCGAILTISLS